MKTQQKEKNNAQIFNKIKSPSSIKLINRLHKSLTNIENNCNQNIAHKYLIGFLEEKGVRSYDEFIDSLV